MSALIQADLSLWYTLRTRRRRQQQLSGLDATAFRWRARLKHVGKSVAYLQAQARLILDQEKYWADLSNDELNQQIRAIREVFARRNYNEEQIRAALGAIREVASREVGKRPFQVQIMGALGMFHGQIVEMATGEGKTLTAAVASSLLAWLRRPVHVITVNDYLAQRDAEEYQPVFARTGLRAGSILGDTPPPERVANYRLPIVYTTQKELVADWLRDQLRMGRVSDPVSMRWRAGSLHQRQAMADTIMVPGLHVALVDELDSVLIDEAVTPLIIAQPRGTDAQGALYEQARDFAAQLTINVHFKVDIKARQVDLTRAGRSRIAKLVEGETHVIWRAQRRREEMITQALVAVHCYHDGQQYQIVEDQVVIVDEYTGRFMPDRQWQHGLHQAVEAKHHLEVTADRDTLASLSFQRFFKQYSHLCGMTGTAADAKAELETTYGLPVRVIPTNRPVQRQRWTDLIFTTSKDRWEAVLQEIIREHQKGRPVLVGTRSIEASEWLSSLLNPHGIEHQVLNAVHHKVEAEIVARAGEPGAVTVATNMAGRGTDIKLGEGVREAGGLHVILTERHTSSRVDRQLFGRAGRQGDPGSARVIVSLEDELVLKYTPTLSAMLRRRFAGRSEPLPQWVRYLFDVAQRRAQKIAFRGRASTLKHEEELDKALPI